MTYFILNGSPRGAGSTTMATVRAFLDGATKGTHADIREVTLRDLKIGNCRGCYTCWARTPGVCVQKDGMDGLLEAYVRADVVIWATPVYHFGMTSLMKTFLERTLPLLYPYQIFHPEDGLYHHPSRFPEVKGRRNLLFATCGFPDADNFRVLQTHFEKLLGKNLDLSVFVPEAEVLKIPPLRERAAGLLTALRDAGAQWSATGSVSAEGLARINTPMIPRATWAELASAAWSAPGEVPPTPEQVRGERPYDPTGPRRPEDKQAKGYATLRRMAAVFDPAKAGGMKAVVEFAFEDVGESYHMVIKDGTCELLVGPAPKPTTRIVTTLQTWEGISGGSIDGQKALMEGRYRVEGDFGFMMKMADGIFGRRNASTGESVQQEPARPGRNLLWAAFIPWCIAWIFGGSGPVAGIVVPLLVSVAFLLFREMRREATWFERGTVACLAAMAGLWTISPDFTARFEGALRNGMIALLWGVSLLARGPLTSEYSRANYPAAVAQTELFYRINAILTGLWAVLFGLESVAGFTIRTMSQGRLGLLMLAAVVPAMVLTIAFPKLYFRRMARRRTTPEVLPLRKVQ